MMLTLIIVWFFVGFFFGMVATVTVIMFRGDPETNESIRNFRAMRRALAAAKLLYRLNKFLYVIHHDSRYIDSKFIGEMEKVEQMAVQEEAKQRGRVE